MIFTSIDYSSLLASSPSFPSMARSSLKIPQLSADQLSNSSIYGNMVTIQVGPAPEPNSPAPVPVDTMGNGQMVDVVYTPPLGKWGLDEILEYNSAPKMPSSPKAAEVTVQKALPPPPDGTKMPIDGVSIFKNRFVAADHTPAHWTYYPSIGWVHKQERDLFRKHYGCCSVDGTWHEHDKLGYLVNGDCIQISLAEKRGLVECAASHRYTTADDLIDALDRNDRVVKVSKYMTDRGGSNGCALMTCDYSKKTNYLATAMMRIHRSPRYKYVAAKVVKDSGAFLQCGNCSNWNEAEMVLPRTDLQGSPIICNHCYLPHLKKDAIRAWNDKHYPAPMVGTRPRRGAKVDATTGLIVATGVIEQVPVARLFGVEVETEMSLAGVKAAGLNRYDLAVSARKALGTDFVVCKEDGSLLANGKYSDGAEGSYYAGFEIVSAPADMATHKERWARLANAKGFKYLRAWDTDTCGFHVHVSRESLTSLQIGRILVFINDSNNTEFIQLIAGRGSDKWCRYLAKKLTDPLHPERVISPEEEDRYNRSRRVAVNLSNSKTIEFRIFRGTINPKHIIRNIEFVDAVCDFCYPASRSLRDFTGHREFIRFVSRHRKQWPLLAEWFAKSNLIKVKNSTSDKADPSKFTLKPESVEEHAVPKVIPERAKLIADGPISETPTQRRVRELARKVALKQAEEEIVPMATQNLATDAVTPADEETPEGADYDADDHIGN